MKNSLLSLLTITSLFLAPSLRADEVIAPVAAVEDTSSAIPADTTPSTEDGSPSATTPPTPEAEATTSTALDTSSEEEGTPVGQASNEGSKIAKKKTWQNVGLAIVSVAIAVTALILVSQNEGHGKHHHSH